MEPQWVYEGRKVNKENLGVGWPGQDATQSVRDAQNPQPSRMNSIPPNG